MGTGNARLSKKRNSDILAKIILYICDRFVIELINKIKNLNTYSLQNFTCIRITNAS